MAVTTICAMLNAEPYHFEATFGNPYEQITANEILEEAATFLVDYYRKHAFWKRSFSGRRSEVRRVLLLRRLKKVDAFALSSEHQPGSPISEIYPSEYTLMAANWYWKTGYNLSSDAVDANSLLATVAPLPDATTVRWYILLSDPSKVLLEPSPLFAVGELYIATAVIDQRKEYMNLVRKEIDRMKYLPKQQIPTPPKSNYGPNPVTLVPIFAEAYNMLAHPESVELEVGTREGAFDIHRNVSRFILAVREQPNDEKVFSAGISVVLKDLLDFLEIELQYSVNDGNRRRVAEIDWVGFCHTAHRMLCVPFSGKSREEYGTGGDSIAQNILALKCLLAVRPEFQLFIQLTACPILILAVEGTYVRVEAMCFSTDIYSVELFTANLKAEQSPKERYALAVKFQVVRNTVRKLCEFYTNLHAAMRPPTAPYLFPQPSSLLQCLVPPPAPEVVHRLASLNLKIFPCVGTTRHRRSLYNGLISPEPSHESSVCVKIVPGEYGVAAHELLAQQDPPLAPKLFWCGAVTAGHTMVVMEELETELGRRDPHPRKYNQDDIDIVERDIGRAVALLHAHDLVHGDLRDPNMITLYGRGHLIDFDAAGVEGVAKYPPSLNPKIVWPADAYDLLSMPISKEDDRVRFKRTVEELRGKHDAPPKQDTRDGEEGLKSSRPRSGADDSSGYGQDVVDMSRILYYDGGSIVL